MGVVFLLLFGGIAVGNAISASEGRAHFLDGGGAVGVGRIRSDGLSDTAERQQYN